MGVRGRTVGLGWGVAASLAAVGCLAFAAGATAQAAVLDPGPPSIETLSVSQLSSHRATLVAQIDPDRLESTFQFWIEYADCQNVPPGHGECESISVRKVGEGTIPAGASGQYASATATHLQGEYVYGYWVVATNSAGENKSPEQSFEALPEPTVRSESVSGQAPEPIELHATIDPHGQTVYCQFQLVASSDEYAGELECPVFEVAPKLPACTGQYEKGALPIGRLEAGCGSQSVSLNLDEAGVELKVGATYHYRVLVAPAVQTEDTIQWEGPPTIGADQSFTVGEDNVTPQNKPPVAATDDGGGDSISGDGGRVANAPVPLAVDRPVAKPATGRSSKAKGKHRHRRRRHRGATVGRRHRRR